MFKSQVLTARKFALLWLAFGLIAGLALATMVTAGGTAQADGQVTGEESIVTDTVLMDVELGARKSKATVWFYGSGLAANEEVYILVRDSNGVLSDITSQASVFPLVTDGDGSFASKWTLGRFTRKGIAGEGVKTVLIVNSKFKTLATTPLAFCNMAGRAKKVEKGEDVVVPPHCPK